MGKNHTHTPTINKVFFFFLHVCQHSCIRAESGFAVVTHGIGVHCRLQPGHHGLAPRGAALWRPRGSDARGRLHAGHLPHPPRLQSVTVTGYSLLLPSPNYHFFVFDIPTGDNVLDADLSYS